MRMVGNLLGLAFGALGLVLAWGLLTILGGSSVIPRFPLSVTIGAATVLLVASWLGGQFASRPARSSSWAPAFGAFTAVVALELGVLLGSIPELLADLRTGSTGLGAAVFDFVVKPLYWVSLFGLLPAILLGLFFGVVLRGVLLARGEQSRDLACSGTSWWSRPPR